MAITLNNHHQSIFDMQPRLQAVCFSALADPERFKAVRVENENTLVWDNLCQITIDEIIHMIER